MRAREKLRNRKKAAKINPMSVETIERYLQAYQCPYCKDGITYKMLALHIHQMHDISAYEFRKMFGMDRGHGLCSFKTSELMALKHAKPNKAFMEYDRLKSTLHRYEDGGQREETIKRKQVIAKRPEVQQRFKKALAGIDRKAVAAKIPREIVIARSRKGGRNLWKKRSPAQKKEAIKRMRSGRTPESERRRAAHAVTTMKATYWSNAIWRDKWRQCVTEGIQAKARIKRSEYAAITVLYEGGMSQGEIAAKHGASQALIGLIIKSHRLGLSKLER